jgi:hypothetical protein
LLDVAAGIRVNSAGSVTSGFANGVNIGTWDVLGYDANDLVLGGYRASQFTGLRFYTGGSERARINSSGNVGIGTTSPGTTLAVNGNIGSSGRGNSFGYTLPDWRIYNSSSGGALVIDNYTTEALRVDSSNRLLVGTSTALGNIQYLGTDYTPKLQVQGTDQTNSLASLIRTDGFSPILFLGTGSNGNNPPSGRLIGAIAFNSFDGTNYIHTASIEAIVDGTPGANDMPGRLVFSTTADGSASPTERMRITSTGQVRLAGAGITFNGDTAAANELDDYEEGTWTPTQGAGLTVVGTFTSNGHYTKVGRQVTVQGYVSGSTSVAVAANTVMCGGLPFIVMNVTGSNFIGSASNTNLTALMNVWANQVASTVYAVTSMAATQEIYFTVSYFTV